MFARRVSTLLLVLYCSGEGGRGNSDFHMKDMGMVLVSLRAVNFRVWSHLGCSGLESQCFYIAIKVSLKLHVKKM